MDYNLAILHKNTVKIKFYVSLSYKQGADLGLSRWRVGGFSKSIQKFCQAFFRLTKLIF